MSKQHDPEEESSFLQYLDANNLYGWAMSQPLPTGGFKWVMPDEIEEHSDKGYLLELEVRLQSFGTLENVWIYGWMNFN